MALDKLLAQFVVVLLAVVAGLWLYDRMFRPPTATPAAAHGAALAADTAAERALVDRAALRAEIAGATSGLRVALVEYWMSTGHWPQRLAEVGYTPMPEWRYLEGVELLPEGVLRIARRAAFGGGAVTLSPKADPGSGTVQWRCASDWEDAALLVPGCP